MSHELRTPLTSSLGSLGLLKGLGSHDLSEQNRDLIEIAIRNNEALLRLVNELLDFEKYQTGHLSFEMRRLDLRQLTQDTVSDNQGFAQTNSVLFSCQTTPESCYALIDPHRFVQVLVNLLSNAAKFSEEHSLIEVTVEKRNGSVVVSVKDRGPGIPDEFRSQVFEPFSQADGSSTRKHGGTGLGLSISKAMTEGMNGTLNFKARKDSGTTFFMTFSAIDIPEQDAADC